MGSGSLRDASCPSTNIGVEVVRAVATSQRALRFNLNSNSCGRNLENRCQRYKQTYQISSSYSISRHSVLIRCCMCCCSSPKIWRLIEATPPMRNSNCHVYRYFNVLPTWQGSSSMLWLPYYDMDSIRTHWCWTDSHYSDLTNLWTAWKFSIGKIIVRSEFGSNSISEFYII